MKKELLPAPRVTVLTRRLGDLRHVIHRVHFLVWIAGGVIWGLAISYQGLDPTADRVKDISAALAILFLFIYGVHSALQTTQASDPFQIEAGRNYVLMPAESEDLEAVCAIAHAWFGSKKLGGIDGRMRYMRRLQDARPDVFWVVWEVEGGVRRVIGYTSVVPMLPDVCAKHLAGEQHQYRLRAEDLVPVGDPRVLESSLYLQAIAVHPARRHDARARTLVKEMVSLHVAALLETSEKGRDFLLKWVAKGGLRLHGEEFSRGGRAAMMSMGFVRHRGAGPNNNTMFSFAGHRMDTASRFPQVLIYQIRMAIHLETRNIAPRGMLAFFP